jgi:hypothetical protein
MTDIGPQVQAMLDREAIRDLALRYAHLVWQNQPLATVDLFTADGSVDLGPDGGLIEGREALRAAYSHIVDGMVLHPFVHNHVIDLDGDSASGIAYIDLRCIRDGKSLMGSGYYEDQYAKEDGVWKFRSRKITMHYLVIPGEGWDQPYGVDLGDKEYRARLDPKI